MQLKSKTRWGNKLLLLIYRSFRFYIFNQWTNENVDFHWHAGVLLYVLCATSGLVCTVNILNLGTGLSWINYCRSDGAYWFTIQKRRWQREHTTLHMFMYLCHEAAGAVGPLKAADRVGDGTGRRSNRFLHQQRWDWTGADRTGEDGTGRLGDTSTHSQNVGQRFAVAKVTDTRTQPWNHLTTLLPVLIHPHSLHRMERKGQSGATVL